MTDTLFTTALLALFDEIIDSHHGMVIDEGTSLHQTLASISHDLASKSTIPGGATLAAHADHVRYYIEVLDAFIAGRDLGTVDWGECWRTVSTVNEVEWEAMKVRLEESCRRVRGALTAYDSWEDERRVGGAMGIVVHTAYHLGAMRQMLKVLAKTASA